MALLTTGLYEDTRSTDNHEPYEATTMQRTVQNNNVKTCFTETITKVGPTATWFAELAQLTQTEPKFNIFQDAEAGLIHSDDVASNSKKYR